MSVVKNDACACSFCNSGGGGVEDQNMTQPFNVPSQAVPELIEPSDKVAWLSEARYSYGTADKLPWLSWAEGYMEIDPMRSRSAVARSSTRR